MNFGCNFHAEISAKTKKTQKTKQKNIEKNKNTSYKSSNIFRKDSLRFPLNLEKSDSPNLK